MKAVIAGALSLVVSQSVFALSSLDVNQSITINYGIIEAVSKKKVDSNAMGGAVLGGIIGAATSGHHHRGEHAAIGAASGGVLTAMMQGNRDAYAYTIELMNGGEKEIVTEQSGIVQGDCVAVEEGRMANVRRVPAVHCEHHGHPAGEDYLVQSKSHESAAECHVAKEMALRAEGEEAMDVALKKVEVFCN